MLSGWRRPFVYFGAPHQSQLAPAFLSQPACLFPRPAGCSTPFCHSRIHRRDRCTAFQHVTQQRSASSKTIFWYFQSSGVNAFKRRRTGAFSIYGSRVARHFASGCLVRSVLQLSTEVSMVFLWLCVNVCDWL